MNIIILISKTKLYCILQVQKLMKKPELLNNISTELCLIYNICF